MAKYMRKTPIADVDFSRCVPLNFISSRYFVMENGEVFEISKDMETCNFLPVVWNKKNNDQLFIDFGKYMKDMDVLIYEHFHPVAKLEQYEFIEIKDSAIKNVDNIRPVTRSEYNARTFDGAIDTNNFRELRVKMPVHFKPVKKSGSR